jgi:hypothetical protein
VGRRRIRHGSRQERANSADGQSAARLFQTVPTEDARHPSHLRPSLTLANFQRELQWTHGIALLKGGWPQDKKARMGGERMVGGDSKAVAWRDVR